MISTKAMKVSEFSLLFCSGKMNMNGFFQKPCKRMLDFYAAYLNLSFLHSIFGYGQPKHIGFFEFLVKKRRISKDLTVQCLPPIFLFDLFFTTDVMFSPSEPHQMN